MLASCQKLILYSWIDVDAAPLEYCFAGQTTINAVIRTYSDHSCSCQTGVLEHPPAVIIVIAIKKMARSWQLLIQTKICPLGGVWENQELSLFILGPPLYLRN